MDPLPVEPVPVEPVPVEPVPVEPVPVPLDALPIPLDPLPGTPAPLPVLLDPLPVPEPLEPLPLPCANTAGGSSKTIPNDNPRIKRFIVMISPTCFVVLFFRNLLTGSPSIRASIDGTASLPPG